MKKIWNIIVVMLLLTSVSSIILADETEESQENELEIDDETQEETRVMKTYMGASIRLLQLEKAITQNILKGEKVVSVLKLAEINATSLEAILAEMELLLLEVQSVDINSSDVVQIFVDLKSDAIGLTKDFRETVKELVDENMLEQLRERIRETISGETSNLSNAIQKRIRHFNRNQFSKIFGLIGDVNSSLLEEYSIGNITLINVTHHLQKQINEMTKEQRYRLFMEFKQEQIRERIQSRICVENVTENFRQRKEERITNRLRHIQNSQYPANDEIRHELEQQISNRLNTMNGGGNMNNNGDVGGSGNGDGGGDTGGKGGRS